MTEQFTAILNKLVDNQTSDCKTIGRFYGVDSKKLVRQYRNYISEFKSWKQKPHAKEWLIYSENIWPHLSIDETDFSKGEFYTIVTNKKTKGKKGAIIGILLKLK